MLCQNCGNQISDGTRFCPECGQRQENVYTGESTYTQHPYDENTYNGGTNANNGQYNQNYYQGMNQGKSRLAAGLLQIFLGGLGIGRFYLGYTGLGVAQLLVSIFTCGVGSIWGFVDGILILCGQLDTDANGVPLRD